VSASAAAATTKPISISPTLWPMFAVAAGVAALLIPTLATLATTYWSTENGAQGPLILVSSLWLFWRERPVIDWRPGSISNLWLLLIPPLLLIYVGGRSLDMLGTETGALYLLLVLLGFFYWGPATMRRLWFAVLYAGFLIQPPEGLLAQLTTPLKVWLSEAAVGILSAAGYPIANSGVLIQIAQYELLVKQACAGLGSLVTLLALGLLTVHLMNPPGRLRKAVLIASILPIAILANLLRILLLLLLTYHGGDSVAQGFAHDLAGIFTFALSVGGMLCLEALLRGEEWR
jgi:exosortase